MGEFYLEENLPFRRLVWSKELAEDSSNWADRITPTCTIIRQPGLNEGENISARSARCTGQPCIPRDEGPETILTRWVDNKKDKGYPINQSATRCGGGDRAMLDVLKR